MELEQQQKNICLGIWKPASYQPQLQNSQQTIRQSAYLHPKAVESQKLDSQQDSYIAEYSTEPNKPILGLLSRYFQDQDTNICWHNEDKYPFFQPYQNSYDKLILFFSQFIEKAIISNYRKTKYTHQMFLVISRQENLPVNSGIIQKLLAMEKSQEILQFMKQQHENVDLMPFNSSQEKAAGNNKTALIRMFKNKYFNRSNGFLWKFQSEIDFAALQKDFSSENIKVYLLDQNTIFFINKQKLYNRVQYINYQWEKKYLKPPRISNIFEDITQISSVTLSQQLMEGVFLGKNQKLKSLRKILQKNESKCYITQKVFLTTQMRIDSQLHFDQSQDLAEFLRQVYNNSFYITQQRQLKQNPNYISCRIEDYFAPQTRSEHSNEIFSQKTQSQGVQVSLKQILKKYDQTSVSMIRKVKTTLKQSHIWDFLWIWNMGLKQVLQKIMKNWPIYVLGFQQQMIQFNHMLEYKLQRLKQLKIGIYDEIFKDIFEKNQQMTKFLCIQRLQKLLKNVPKDKNGCSNTGYQKGQHSLQQEQKQKNLDFFQNIYQIKRQSLIQQVLNIYIQHKSSPNRDLPLIVKIGNNSKTRLNVSQFIAEGLTQRKQLTKLRSFITIINYYLGENKNTSVRNFGKSYNQSEKVMRQTSQDYFIKIEEERVVETRCLGCSTFFKDNTNILDQAINTIPFKVFSSVEQMKENESQIKDQICAMLNSGGGIILFDCIQQYQKIIVRGILLNQKSKEQYEQRFTSYLDTFQPKINVKRCIDIKFVPVIADMLQFSNNSIILENYTGQESLIRQNQSYRLRPYLRNVYVMRVRICPQEGDRVYFWNQNNDKEQKEINKSYLCTTIIDGVKASIKMSKIGRLIKQKVKKYYLPQKYKGDERKCLEVPFSCFNHQCRDPQAGVGALLQLNSDSKLDSRQSSQHMKSSSIATGKLQNLSLLIAKRQHLSQIKRRLISEGIQCQIQEKFLNYKFQSAKNSAVLYHNKRFEDVLKKVLQNPKFNFNGKQLIIINITNFVKLTRRSQTLGYPLQEFINLKNWLSKEFPDDQLKLFEFKSDSKQKNKEYYLQTESSESTLFIYYVLNKFGEKAVFKNPLHLDKMSPEQKQSKFTQIYTNMQSLHQEVKEDVSQLDICWKQPTNIAQRCQI